MNLSEFYIYHDKYIQESNKSIDWGLKASRLEGTDRQIALLYRKKHHTKSLKYLKRAAKFLKNGRS